MLVWDLWFTITHPCSPGWWLLTIIPMLHYLLQFAEEINLKYFVVLVTRSQQI